MSRFSGKSKERGPSSWTISDLGSFYVNNRATFLSHAQRLLKDSIRAEEVVQDAFMRVVLAAPELKSEEHCSAYIHRTIENLCMDIFRMEARRPNLVLLDDASSEMEKSWASSDDLSEELVQAEDAAIVRQALALLSPAERAALVMWEVEGRSAREIAVELGLKESSVRHTVARARSTLKKILSELVIDQSSGYTALDLLSKSYRKSVEVAKKSSKAALSLIFVFFAFIGYNSLPDSNISTFIQENQNTNITKQSNDFSTSDTTGANLPSVEVVAEQRSSTKAAAVQNVRITPINFPGLDKSGVPTGFTVSDSTGSLGTANFFERTPVSSETELVIGQIIKTDTGAANIFLSQTLTTDSSGLSYRPTLSFGRSGSWVPLLIKVTSTDITRQINGNYLFTAFIRVESAIDTPIQIVASASGRDLIEAPKQVITRLVMDPSKTKVLAQAIYVVERDAKA